VNNPKGCMEATLPGTFGDILLGWQHKPNKVLAAGFRNEGVSRFRFPFGGKVWFGERYYPDPQNRFLCLLQHLIVRNSG